MMSNKLVGLLVQYWFLQTFVLVGGLTYNYTLLDNHHCDPRYCDSESTVVNEIKLHAKISRRDVPNLYRVPTKFLDNAVLPEQCYVHCLEEYSNGTQFSGDGYNIPNTAALRCMDNMEAFLCIAACLYHITPEHSANVYNLYGEIQKDVFTSTWSSFNATLNNKYSALLNLSNIAANYTKCSDYCSLPGYGICDTAFEGNPDKAACATKCKSSQVCSNMCDLMSNVYSKLTNTSTGQNIPEKPTSAPSIYWNEEDVDIQKSRPSLYYNISGTQPESLNGSIIGIVWKVDFGGNEIHYYPTHFRNSFELSQEVAHEAGNYGHYSHYNHTGSQGYLDFIDFCAKTEISFALINEFGASDFSAPVKACMPGTYYPTPPAFMNISADIDKSGEMTWLLTLPYSKEHKDVSQYMVVGEISGELTSTEPVNGNYCLGANGTMFFKHIFSKDEELVLESKGNDLQEYNFSLAWNCMVTFHLTVEPHIPPNDKGKRPLETTVSYNLEELDFGNLQLIFPQNVSFVPVNGLPILTLTPQLNSSTYGIINVRTYFKGFRSQVTILQTNDHLFLDATNGTSSTQSSSIKHWGSNGSIVYRSEDLSYLGTYCLVSVKIVPVILPNLNSRYKSNLTATFNTNITLQTPRPSKVLNVTTVHNVNPDGLVFINVSWRAPENPYGTEEFKIFIFEANLEKNLVLLSGDTKEVLASPKALYSSVVEMQVLESAQYTIGIQAKSKWNLNSEWVNTTLIIEYSGKGIPFFIWAIIGVVALVALILLSLIICLVTWYYRRNKVIVIPTSDLFIENAIGDDASNENMPLVSMDFWEINPEDIMVHELLGEGNFGKVYRGEVKSAVNTPSTKCPPISSSGLVVAVKLLKPEASNTLKSEFLREIEMLKKISCGNCPYIVNVVGCSTHEEPLALILEYAPNGDLLTYLRTLRKMNELTNTNDGGDASKNQYVNGPNPTSNTDVKDNLSQYNDIDDEAWSDTKLLGELTPAHLVSFGWQIASGMEYLSQLGIVHRDLACRNVLVGVDKQLKVSDFGLARENECYVKTTEGKLPLRWMALESIQDRVFTTKSDVWAFGVTLWEIATLGGHPYPTLTNRAILGALLHGQRLEKPRTCSNEWYQLLHSCWASIPEERPSFKELQFQLEVMLNNVHQGNYIDLNVDENLPYYPMSAAGARDSDEETDGEPPVKAASSEHNYPDPQNFDSTLLDMGSSRMTLNVSCDGSDSSQSITNTAVTPSLGTDPVDTQRLNETVA